MPGGTRRLSVGRSSPPVSVRDRCCQRDEPLGGRATMSIALPGPVAAYFAAEEAGDADALARCFDEHGVGRDECGDFTGVTSIREWNAAARLKYHHTVEPLSALERDGQTIVIGKVSGNFPNSPLSLEHAFVLEGDKIASLVIR